VLACDPALKLETALIGMVGGSRNPRMYSSAVLGKEWQNEREIHPYIGDEELLVMEPSPMACHENGWHPI
jgi:hypothetical protein